jgi:hypothetical protein
MRYSGIDRDSKGAETLLVSKPGIEVQVDLYVKLTEGLHELTTRLRRELRQLDVVDSVCSGATGTDTTGCRGHERWNAARNACHDAQARANGRGHRPGVVSRLRRRSVKVEVGDGELEVTGMSPVQQNRLIADSIACRAGG